MLETEIKKLTEAVIANTAARTGRKPAAAPQEVPIAATKPAQASPAAAAPAVDVLSEEPAATAAPVFTKEQVVKAVIKLAKLSGREVAVTLMSTFGAKKASELNDVEKYPAIMTAIDAALPAEADII